MIAPAPAEYVFGAQDLDRTLRARRALASCTRARQCLLIQVAGCAAVVLFCAASVMDLLSSVMVSSWLFTLCTVWMLYSWSKIARSILSPYWVFVAVAALFNGGHALLQTFGLARDGVLNSTFSEATTCNTILYSTLSLMMLHSGALWRAAKRSTDDICAPSADAERRAIQLGLLLVLIALVPTYLQFKENLGTVLQSGYFGLYQREVKTNIGAWEALLAQFLLPGAFLIAASSRRRRALRVLSVAIVLTYVAVQMFTGYRGAAGAAAAAFGCIWHLQVRRLPLYSTAAAGLLFVFVLFPMVRVFRSTAGEDRLDISGFARTLDSYDNPAAASIREMGGSMATTAYTMDLVPAVRDFDFGRSYFYAALTVMPNLFGTPLHPSVARGTASEWLIQTTSYRTAVSGGGVGYSFIAETYLNFGWLGAPMVLILLGYAFSSLEFAAARSSAPGIAALMGVVLYFAVIYARAETTNVVRGIIWCGLAPMLLLKLFGGVQRVRHLSAALRA